MDSCYANTLKVCIPVLGLCSAGIQLSTIHARFVNATPSSPEAPDWPLRKLFSLMFLAFEESKAPEAERQLSTSRFTNLHRNFIENVTPFSMLALGVAVLVTKPSKSAVVAVQAFTASRIIHNLIFVFYNEQPFRAFAFVPQLLAQGVLIVELLRSRKA